MNEFLKAIFTGTVTFTVTNIDDIFILMLFFSQGAAVYSCRAIVAGQYFGFTALVLISLLGFLAGLIVPRAYIGFLGIVPIIIGVRAWLNRKKDENKEQEEKAEVEAKGKKDKASIVSSIFGIAAITFANGGDNIGIYTPLFANTTLPHLLIILAVFYVLLGVWCLVGYFITRQPHIAHVLNHYSHFIVPFVLIALGIFIMYESGSFHLLVP